MQQFVPSPSGGLDAKSPTAQMEQIRAIELQNWLPGYSTMVPRGGKERWQITEPNEQINSLFTYVSAGKWNSVLASTSTGIWLMDRPRKRLYEGDVKKLQAATLSGLTDVFVVLVGEALGKPLVLKPALPQDARYGWSGLTIEPWEGGRADGESAILRLSQIRWVYAHGNRIWMGEEGSNQAWYTAPHAFQGDLKRVVLVPQRGGGIVGMASYSRDRGFNMEDFHFFVTALGDCIAYQGDPELENYTKVGEFDIGSPIGDRWHVRLGSDTIFLTDKGLVSVSEMLATAGAGRRFMEYVNPQIHRLILKYPKDKRWGLFVHDKSNQFLIWTPESVFGVNYNTLASTVLLGWSPIDMVQIGGDVFFAESGGTNKPSRVFRISERPYDWEQAGTGFRYDNNQTYDSGQTYQAETTDETRFRLSALQAYNYLGDPNVSKRVRRVGVRGTNLYNARVALRKDFDTGEVSEAVGSDGSKTGLLSKTATGQGRAFAVEFVSESNDGAQWDGSEITYETSKRGA